MTKSATPTIASLNAGLYDLVETMPKARTELVDFYFKHAVEDYVTAIQEAPGRKAVVMAESGQDAASVLRRAMIAADMVTFNVSSFLGHPLLVVIPISDELASPVLAASAETDPATGRYLGFAQAAHWMMAMAAGKIASVKESDFPWLFGQNWSQPGEPRWARTTYARLADPCTSAQGEPMHLAGGAIHVQIPREDSLLTEIEPLMRAGRVAYAPFVSMATDFEALGEGVLKSDMLNSTLLAPTSAVGPVKGTADPLLDLDIPYLEDIPLPLLAKVLDDEGESLSMFRRKLDRALEDVSAAKDDAEAAKRILKLKRDELEDELDKVRQVCDKVARMNSIARSGVYVAGTALSIAGVYGLALPSVIAGCSAPVVAALKALYDGYEAKREARRSSMYFVWRLSKV